MIDGVIKTTNTGWHGPSGRDGVHFRVDNVKFNDGAELHFFVNAAGHPYAGIYHDGMECCTSDLLADSGLIEHYKASWENCWSENP